MKDKIIQEEVCNIKGYAKVQLFDAKTGKLKHEQEGENFITHATKASMKAFQARQIFMGRNGAVYNEKYDIPLQDGTWNTVHSESGNQGPFQHIVLTDDARVEDAATQQRVAGNFLAYANAHDVYAGTDAVRGTININETKALAALDKISYVFDFATDVANGTFQSIWFTPYNIDSDADIASTNGIAKITPQHVQAAEAVNNYPEFFFDGDFIYTTHNFNIYAQSVTTDEYALISTTPAPNYIDHICRDAVSGLFYCASSSSSVLLIYSPGTDTWTTSATGSPNTTQMITAYGGYIFTNNVNAPVTFRRILVSDNTQFDDWSLGLSESCRVFFVDATGYHFFTATKYYKANTWGGAVTFQRHIGIPSNNYIGTWDNKIGGIDYRGDRTVFYTYDLDIENATAASRKLLPAPVTKTAGEVMKITYTFEIV